MKVHEDCPPRNEELVAPLPGTVLDLDFVFAEKTLMVVYFTCIYPESNRSRIGCFIPEPVRLRIPNLHIRIRSRPAFKNTFGYFMKFGHFLAIFILSPEMIVGLEPDCSKFYSIWIGSGL